jgi:hypothetical protein
MMAELLAKWRRQLRGGCSGQARRSLVAAVMVAASALATRARGS